MIWTYIEWDPMSQDLPQPDFEVSGRPTGVATISWHWRVTWRSKWCAICCLSCLDCEIEIAKAQVGVNGIGKRLKGQVVVWKKKVNDSELRYLILCLLQLIYYILQVVKASPGEGGDIIFEVAFDDDLSDLLPWDALHASLARGVNSHGK